MCFHHAGGWWQWREGREGPCPQQWVAAAQLPAPCHVAGPQLWAAFLDVSPCPPSPPGAREAAPRPSVAQGALAAAR